MPKGDTVRALSPPLLQTLPRSLLGPGMINSSLRSFRLPFPPRSFSGYFRRHLCACLCVCVCVCAARVRGGRRAWVLVSTKNAARVVVMHAKQTVAFSVLDARSLSRFLPPCRSHAPEQQTWLWLLCTWPGYLACCGLPGWLGLGLWSFWW